MKASKILITGAAGFTGRHACEHFSKAGFQVIPVVRTKKGSDFELTYNVIECDLTNKTGVMMLLNSYEPDYVLHLAGQNSVEQSWKESLITFESNVMTTINLLEAIRNSGKNSKVIIVGSALEMDLAKANFPQHPYSLSKTIQTLCSRSWAHLFNMDIMIVKPSNLIGPGYSNGICSIIGRQVASMIKGHSEKVIEVNDLSAHRDFLDVRDAVTAYHIILEKGESGNIYDIASGETHSIEEVVLGFGKIADIEITIRSKLPFQERFIFKIDKSELKNLGWKPSIPFNMSLKDVLTFYLQLYKGE
jgi:GDP-4-dehydro-6-deoxy-D-mannose reductase